MSAAGTPSADGTYDVVVIGVGLSGVATALSASLRGLRAVVLEKADKLQGASWWSGGQVWVPANHVQAREGRPDSLEEGMTYVRTYSSERPDMLDEDHLKRWLTVAPEAVRWFEDQGAATFSIIPGYPDYEYPDVPGSRAEGRYLSAVFDARRLGPWRDKLSTADIWPVGTTYEELMGVHQAEAPEDAEGTAAGVSAFGVSAETTSATAELAREDLLTMGPGVVAGFFVRALEAGVEVRLEHRVVEILMEDGRAVGVRAETPDGTIEVRGAVVIATSGFDHDPELVARYSGSGDVLSLAPPNLTGDGIRLARAAGADIFEFPPENISVTPGYASGEGNGYGMAMDFSMPHTFIVDRHARRFADDAMYWRVARAALDPGGDHLPAFMIWDEQHHARYGFGTTPAGEPYPDGLVTSAPTLRELGERLGLDGEALEATAARFNADVTGTGADPDFGRGTGYYGRVLGGDPTHPIHPNLGPVDQAPFFGIRLAWGGAGVGLTGVRVDADAHALDEDGTVIPGLYAVGAAAAFTTSGVGYNSGYSLSRAVTHGYLVGADLAARRPAGG